MHHFYVNSLLLWNLFFTSEPIYTCTVYMYVPVTLIYCPLVPYVRQTEAFTQNGNNSSVEIEQNLNRGVWPFIFFLLCQNTLLLIIFCLFQWHMRISHYFPVLLNWFPGWWSGLELSLFDWLLGIPWRKPIYTEVLDFGPYRFNLVNRLWIESKAGPTISPQCEFLIYAGYGSCFIIAWILNFQTGEFKHATRGQLIDLCVFTDNFQATSC